MTFDELVADVMERLNLTSTDAQTRIGDYINRRYKQVTSSLGLITSRLITASIAVDPSDTITFPNLPELTITGIEKINKIWISDTNGITVFKQITYDEITSTLPLNREPRIWAVKLMVPNSVTIVLDAVTSTPYTLHYDGYDHLPTLSGSAEPQMPTDFHDILVEGAMADELYKMEKPQLAIIRDQAFAARMSELRMFIAKSGWIDLYQGKTRPRSAWYWPWMTRNSNLGIE